MSNTEPGQWTSLLGCDLVDEALASISDEYEQHIARLHNSIIEICNRELRRPEVPSHLATPSGKRKRRFTSAQKAMQALLSSASGNQSVNLSTSSGSVKRVTRARVKKALQDMSANSSYENRPSSNLSVPETKGKRKGKGKLKKDEEGFVKPLEPVNKPESSTPSVITSPSSVKTEQDEVDSEKLAVGVAASLPIEIIQLEVTPKSEEKEIRWNVKRVEIISPSNKEKVNPKSVPVSNVNDAKTPSENGQKTPCEPAPADNDWTTDEESFESVASIGDETYFKLTGNKCPTNSCKKLSTGKKKRKQTEYFTPSVPRKSARITRATTKLENTPKTESLTKTNLLTKALRSVTKSSIKQLLSEKSSGATTSGSSIGSSATTIASFGRPESAHKKGAISRTCTTPDMKTLTASAAKRRLADEERRKAQLAQMREKEDKVLQQKQENLKNKAELTKKKNEEKRKKIELIKKKEEEELKEKRIRELSKLEEIEKRQREKEEARRREILRAQEAAKRKQVEFELRKQQEEEERKARLLKQEESKRNKELQNEDIRREQAKILDLLAQHNSKFQKGQNTSVNQPKLDPSSQFKLPLPPTSTEPQPVLPLNTTFSVDKEAEPVKKEKSPPEKVESYQLTPPPKPKPAPINYDISDIKSDDDTDDEERPRKQIPLWAKGEALIKALDKQFAKSRRAREREIRMIFPSFAHTIELSEVFKSATRVVHQKYQHRTSSAVWDSTLNCSTLTDDL